MQPAGTGPGRDRPRFRQDLIAETVDLQGARFIDVAAPEGGDVFRFYEVEYSLACGMDGERDVAGLVKWAQDELGMTPSHHEVRAVIATLGDLGFIDAAAAEAGGELAVGVVAAAPERAQPSSGVELGAPGAPGSGPTRPAPLPPPPDMALGAPGGRITKPTPAPPFDDSLELGAPGSLGSLGGRPERPTPSPDMSLDLADHLPVGRDDVKEAVRASKVMTAVDVPVDMLDMIQDRPTAPASAFDAPTVARIPEVEALAETTRSPDLGRAEPGRPDLFRDLPEPRPEVRVGKSPPGRQPAASRPPVELPPPPAQTERVRPTAAPRSGVSPVIIVALVLAVLGAGVFLAWKYMIDRPGPDADTTIAPPPVPKPPPPPPPPPAPTAKIALETPEPEDVKLTRNGVIETIVAADTRVKEGDVVVKLVGDKPLEAEIAALTRDQKRIQDAIDAATKRRDTAQKNNNKAAENAAQNEINDRERTLSTKQNVLAAKTADLGGFLIQAAVTGTFTPQVKLGQKLTADAVVGKLQRDPIPTATFKIANTKPYAGNASVEVTIGKGDTRVTCTVADVLPDGVKLSCPTDAALTEGTDVALQAPAATSGAPETAAPAPGSASSGGSAEAPAGAAPTPGTAPPAAPAPGGAPPSGSPEPAEGSSATGSARPPG